MRSAPRDSVRPLTNSNRVGDGPSVQADRGRCEKRGRGLCEAYSKPVFPVAEIGNEDEFVKPDEMIAHDEEEPAQMPLVLPSVYQPTRSEYMDHCVTHYPFRAWCKHCLEGRGREFGHEHGRGDKDERAAPVMSFDYCFVSDVGRSPRRRNLRQLGPVPVSYTHLTLPTNREV